MYIINSFRFDLLVSIIQKQLHPVFINLNHQEVSITRLHRVVVKQHRVQSSKSAVVRYNWDKLLIALQILNHLLRKHPECLPQVLHLLLKVTRVVVLLKQVLSVLLRDLGQVLVHLHPEQLLAYQVVLGLLPRLPLCVQKWVQLVQNLFVLVKSQVVEVVWVNEPQRLLLVLRLDYIDFKGELRYFNGDVK